MTLLSPIPLATVAYAALAFTGLMIVAYILKMRRRRFEVPFSTLWQRVIKERETTTLWKHLRRLLSLLLLLSILAALLFAATEPRLGQADRDARSLVIILDTSASMKTADVGDPGSPHQRFDAAKAKASELISTLGGGDHAMIMRMDGQTTPLSRFENDHPRLQKILEKIVPSDTPADLRRALSAAADALRERQNPTLIIIGDGAYPEEVLNSVSWLPTTDDQLDAIDLSNIDTRFVRIGETHENVGIVAFNVRRYIANKASYEVFVEIKNFGKQTASRKLILYNGDVTVAVQDLELKAGDSTTRIYPDLSGGSDSRLRAVLVPYDRNRPDDKLDEERRDAFPLDDVAFALLPERKNQNVLLVTKDNLYLEGAMLVYENIRVDKLTPDEYEDSIKMANLPVYQAVVFDDYTPTRLPTPTTNALYFNPQGKTSPFEISQTLSRPRLTDVNDSHPVMRWLVVSDVNIDSASVFKVRSELGESALITSVRAPVAVARRTKANKEVAVGFSLSGTDLMLRVAFPLLLVNVLDWFAGDDADLITTYATGRRVYVPLDGASGTTQAQVLAPSGRKSKAPVRDGVATFYADQAGIHKITAMNGDIELARVELAANLSNPQESDIAPSDELNLGGVALQQPAGFVATRKQGMWTYLVLLVALLLGMEWITYNRRITV